MWHLQLPKLPSHLQTLKTLLALSVGLHLSVCTLLFFVQLQKHIQFTTNQALLRNNAIVKLVPFGQKKPPSAAHASNKHNSNSLNKKTNVRKTSLAGAISTNTPRKNYPSKKSPNKKTARVQKQTAKKEVAKAASTKKSAAKKTTALSKQATVTKKKTETNKTPELVKPTTPIEQEAKQEASLPQEAPKEHSVAAPIQKQASATAPQESALLGTAPTVDDQDVVYLTNAEFEGLELQQALLQALQDAWQPPAGISTDVCCKATVCIDWQGTIQSYKVIEPSGILIYDASVEESIKALKAPRLVWGKTIEVSFKPWSVAS